MNGPSPIVKAQSERLEGVSAPSEESQGEASIEVPD